jgi:opacity protein-like surface antigen
MRRVLVCLIPIILLVSSVHAQEVPRVELFGGYSYLNLDTTGRTDRLNFNGFDTNVTFNVNRHFGLEADFAGHFQSPCDQGIAIQANNRCAVWAYMAGPKVSFHNQRFSPFAHVLFGGDRFSNTNLTAGGFTTSQTSWSMAAGGGVDFTVSPRISIRLGQFDYFMTNHDLIIGNFTDPGHQNHFRISTGVVFKFGKR